MSPLNPQSQIPAAPPLRVRAEIGEERRTFTFDKGFRIGRTEECEVCIKNEHVSRKHVEIVVDNGCWMVRDLHSANGIFVNGERVQTVPVYTSVKIRLGIYGPFVELEVAPYAVVPTSPPIQPAVAKPGPNAPAVQKTATHYFG